MDIVLQATPGESAPLLFEEAPSSLGQEGDVIPEDFACFYRGELADHVITKVDNRRSIKRKTVTYRMDLAYRGTAFCGWQTQDKHNKKGSPLKAVQDVVAAALDGRDVRVAGRTDAGVSAFGQVARVRCPPTVTAEALLQQLQAAAATQQDGVTKWTCRRVIQESNCFHPAFGAVSRSYVYLVDGNDAERMARTFGTISIDQLTDRLNALLAPLQGQALSYIALSYGRLKTQTSQCTLHHVRARHMRLNNQPVLAVELTGNRFLRRMVRILVASALDLATAKDSNDPFDANALLHLVQSQDRRLATKPAPAQGLVFVSALYNGTTLDESANFP